MDEKMSDKKEWRAILIDRKSLKKFFNLSIEPIEGMDLTFVEIEDNKPGFRGGSKSGVIS